MKKYGKIQRQTNALARLYSLKKEYSPWAVGSYPLYRINNEIKTLENKLYGPKPTKNPNYSVIEI